MIPAMKKTLLLILSIVGGSFAGLHAQDTFGSDTALVQTHHMQREGRFFLVDLDIDIRSTQVESNRMVVLTPMLVKESDTLSLSSVGLMGRRRYFYYQRNEKLYPEVFEHENYRTNEKPDTLSWAENMPYKGWMNGARLKLHRQLYGCCNDVIDQDIIDLGLYRAYDPVFHWIVPKVENPKIRYIEGSAYVDFVVSQTDIRPDYRNNRREIGKILSGIDSLRADSDITVDSLFIKGFASPESPYSNNTRLAKGRTQALKEYVSQLYKFDEQFIRTSYEPEDWEGLRKFVEESNIDNREAILAIIDSDMEPDAREARIKREYPKEYRFLLDICYPALRHSDYRIWYNIRQFDDIEEMKRIFAESPAKLSLREFCNLAATYEPGSEDFNDVYNVAVTVYPHSEAANLNAANAAMGAEDLKKAARHLAKAGASPEADYARGIYAGLSKEYAKAKDLFLRAAEAAAMSGNTALSETAAKAGREMDEFIGNK